MKRLNMLLHCGSHIAERDQVMETKVPEGTDTWFPIPHSSLISLVEKKLPDYGMTIVQEQHALMREDHRYFGLFQIEPIDETPADDYSLVIGLRNSHDKSFPAGLCLGSGVFVCDNLAFSAEVTIGRRHTRHIMDDLPRLIAAAMGKLVTSRVDQERRIDAYKKTELTDEQAAHMLFMAYEAKAVKQTQLAKVWKEWKEPTHDEFGGRNVWSLMNGVTQVQKGVNPFELTSRTQRLHPLLDVACGITIGGTGIPADIVDAEFTASGQNVLAA